MRLILFILFLATPSFAALNDFDRAEFQTQNILANYNPGFESGLAKWVSGGSTFAAVTSGSNLLFGKGSATIDAASSSVIWRTALAPIPKGYYGKTGLAYCSFMTPSGTSTYTIDVWDGTNVLATQPITSSSTPTRSFVAFTFPSTGSLSLRIVSGSSADPLIAVDDCYIGGPNVVPGAIITAWQTVTCTGAWSSNSAYTCKRRRVGDTLEVIGTIALSGAPTSASLTLTIPESLVIDTSKLSSTNVSQIAGKASLLDSGTIVDSATLRYATTTTLSMVYNSTNTSDAGTANDPLTMSANVTQAAPFTFANGDAIDFSYSVPIVGWNATGSVSTTDLWNQTAKVIARRSTSTQSFSTGVAATLIFDTEYYDNTNSYNTSTGVFTAPKAGYYFIASNLVTTAGTMWDLGETLQMTLNVNSTLRGYLGLKNSVDTSGASSANSVNGSILAYLAKGDTAEIRISQDSGSSVTTISSADRTTLSISEQPDFTIFGAYNDTRTNVAYLNCDSGSAITSQIGSWVSSIGNISAGACTVTLTTGAYSSSPYCTASSSTLISSDPVVVSVNVGSATSVTVDCADNAGSDCTTNDFYLNCVGI